MGYRFRNPEWEYLPFKRMVGFYLPTLWEIDGETEIEDYSFFNPLAEYEGVLADSLSGHECGLILVSECGRIFRACNIDFE